MKRAKNNERFERFLCCQAGAGPVDYERIERICVQCYSIASLKSIPDYPGGTVVNVTTQKLRKSQHIVSTLRIQSPQKRATVHSHGSPSELTEAIPHDVADLIDHEIGFIDNPHFRAASLTEPAKDSFVYLVELGRAAKQHRQRGAYSSTPFGKLCELPLLSADEEKELFTRMNFLKFRANQVRVQLASHPSNHHHAREIRELLERALHVRNYLVLANMRLVMSIAKHFTNRITTFDTAMSEGINCLIKAVEKYDCTRGFRFSTYATSAVRRELYRLVIRNQKRQQRFVTSSDTLETDDVETDRNPQERVCSGAHYQALQQMLARLDPREQYILRARFGFDKSTGNKTTYTAIGKRLGVSKERVRQIAERALGRMRDLSGEFGLDAELVT